MATVTITLRDTGEDIAVKISSDPELPESSEIRSSDKNLTPAQSMAFEMVELYVQHNNVTEGEASELTPEEKAQYTVAFDDPPKKKCCGGGCGRKQQGDQAESPKQ